MFCFSRADSPLASGLGYVTETAPIDIARANQTSTLLPDGKVLIAGGGPFAELYDETTGRFTEVLGSLGAARFFASATLLTGGKALITGGYAESNGELPSTPGAWLYQP
ncbi:MAG: hypothetical protein WA542_09455 [Candidatus Acidiferrum sp.]